MSHASNPVHRLLAAACMLAVLVATACNQQGEGNNLGDAPPAMAGPETPSAQVEDGTLVTQRTMSAGTLTVMSAGGPADYVADSNRRAVYMLDGDNDGRGCSGDCLEQWAPVLPPPGDPSVDGGLLPVLVGTITRDDGTEQLTYKDHPLYHHAGDMTIGATAGHGMTDEWGTWYLLTPQGDAVGQEVGRLDS